MKYRSPFVRFINCAECTIYVVYTMITNNKIAIIAKESPKFVRFNFSRRISIGRTVLIPKHTDFFEFMVLCTSAHLIRDSSANETGPFVIPMTARTYYTPVHKKSNQVKKFNCFDLLGLYCYVVTSGHHIIHIAKVYNTKFFPTEITICRVSQNSLLNTLCPRSFRTLSKICFY